MESLEFRFGVSAYADTFLFYCDTGGVTPPRRGNLWLPQSCTGGIVAVPTDDPVFLRCRYVAGGAMPRPRPYIIMNIMGWFVGAAYMPPVAAYPIVRYTVKARALHFYPKKGFFYETKPNKKAFPSACAGGNAFLTLYRRNYSTIMLLPVISAGTGKPI